MYYRIGNLRMTSNFKNLKTVELEGALSGV